MAESPLTKQELLHFHERLVAGVRKLAQRVAGDVRDSAADVEQPEHSQTLDEGDESLKELLRDVRLELDAREASRAEAMEAALERMAHCEYGICIDCGEQIERARLELEPWTPRCRADQQRLEEE